MDAIHQSFKLGHPGIAGSVNRLHQQPALSVDDTVLRYAVCKIDEVGQAARVYHREVVALFTNETPGQLHIGIDIDRNNEAICLAM